MEMNFDDQFKKDIERVLDSLFNPLSEEDGKKFLIMLLKIFRKDTFNETMVLSLIPRMKPLSAILTILHIMSSNRGIPDDIMAEYVGKRLKERVETHILTDLSKGAKNDM